MNISMNKSVLRRAAQQMAEQLAAALPEEERTASADGLEAQAAQLLHQKEYRRKGRWGWRRGIAAVLAAVLALGTILAVSPQAQAAVSRWFRKITTAVTAYCFPPAESAGVWTSKAPAQMPGGYVLDQDFTDSSGVRQLRYTSDSGDMLLEVIAFDGKRKLSIELRSYLTDGYSDALTGQRPLGEEGVPRDYTVIETEVCGHDAQFYMLGVSEDGERYGPGGAFAIRCYQGDECIHHVALAAHSGLLVWVDEDVGQVFFLFGSVDQELACRMAESMYGERSNS